jgi:3-keto-disaccharide hydrolase
MEPNTAHCGIALALVALAGVAAAQTGDWAIHDETRPQPRVVDPGTGVPPETPGRPPADAVVLFDGKDLAQWRSQKDGGAAAWTVESGYMQVVPKSGGIQTVASFGDCQLHVEWMTPSPAVGAGQDRGNSGVFLMGQYEVQVLDSWENKTYPDGQAGALYGQYPPEVNASRPPGEWQAYDIVFRAPRFDADGRVTLPARLSVFHNGVLVQDARELTGPTAHKARPAYKAHAARLPIGLQDHDHPVRYRNIWVRDLVAP